MTTFQVEQLQLTFSPNVDAFQVERGGTVVQGWPQGRKVVDVVARADARAWLIEVKDYRVVSSPPQPAKVAALPDVVLQKAVDSLVGLAALASGAGEASLQAHALATLQTTTRRVVLHLEPAPAHHAYAALCPNPANVLLKLQQALRAQAPPGIHPEPLVLSLRTTPTANVPWSTR